jgi:hypothetical protein
VRAASVLLARAAVAIGRESTVRLLAGDRDGGARLALLAQLVHEEAELLEGEEKWSLPRLDRGAPPGATVGWFLRHDAHTRRARQLLGLPNPYVMEAAA